jgi:glycosyltransferase involved in cell wall biosynthesis
LFPVFVLTLKNLGNKRVLNMNQNTSPRPDIAIVITPIKDPAGEAIIQNYIEQVKPITGRIYLLAGKTFEIPEKGIHLIRVTGGVARGDEPVLVRSLKFFILQLDIARSLLKLPRSARVVIFQIGTALYILPMLMAKLRGKRIVVFAVGLPSNYAGMVYGRLGACLARSFAIVEKAAFTLADRICVLSESGISLLGLGEYRRKIALSGAQYIDMAVYRASKPLEKRENLVGYIARFEPRKGILNFIRAIPLVLKELGNTRFFIAGHGLLEAEIKQFLKENGLERKVTLTGWIAQDEFPRVLNELKLYVLPSYEEGLPGTIQQAMACGAVVLATRVGGVPDLIKDGETGFILTDNSPENIAAGIIKALRHGRLAEISRNARRLIEQEYSYDSMVQKCQRLLDELTGKN